MTTRPVSLPNVWRAPPTGQIQRVFKIKILVRVGDELPGEGGLAALTRPEDGGDPELLQQGPRFAGDNGVAR